MAPRNSTLPAAVSAFYRFIFVVSFGVTGFVLGRELDLQLLALHIEGSIWQGVLRVFSPVLGACVLVGLSPFAQRLFEDELSFIEQASQEVSPYEVVGGTAGLCVGLVVSLLLRTLFAGFVTAIGMSAEVILILAAVLLCAVTTYLGMRIGGRVQLATRGVAAIDVPMVLDTSAIIDGRLLEVVRCKFLQGPFLVPRFVLSELQSVADSADPVRRARGRRGLELLDELRQLSTVQIAGEILPVASPVDTQLISFALEHGARLITTDFNLNRVARLEGVTVMNVNELAHALRPALVAGQVFDVLVTREGREADQGVGYLEDGTMIVVEGGRSHVGGVASVVVTSVLQTSAGRMVFARAQ